jgi:hypothetical protein
MKESFVKYIRLWIVLIAALGATFAFACGSDSKDDTGKTPAPTSATSEGNGTDQTPNATDDGSSGSANDELSNLAAGLTGHEAKIAYDFFTTGGGADTSGTFTLYWKSADAWRIDFDASGAQATYITKDGKSYICTDAGGEGTCIASPTSAMPIPFADPSALSGLINTEAAGIDFNRSKKDIAGQSATCYSASGSVSGQSGSAEYCFADSGLLLRLDGGSEAGSTFTLEATSVDSSVADADLELPYSVTEIPGQ